jgi:ankyrin repeat protein
MKYIKLFENFEGFDPYELMMIPQQKKAEMLISEIANSKTINIDLVNALIVMGADLSWEDEYRGTALDTALVHNLQLVKPILEAGADPNHKSPRRNPPLLSACDSYKPKTETVKLLLEYGADPNIQDDYGDTPLHVGVKNGHSEIIELLLTNGADPNIQDDKGNTPLHIPANYKIQELLIKHGADETIKNNQGKTWDEMTDDDFIDHEEFGDSDEDE